MLFFCRGFFRWTPQAVIVTIRDNREYIRVLLYSYYTTITGGPPKGFCYKDRDPCLHFLLNTNKIRYSFGLCGLAFVAALSSKFQL